MSLYRTQLNSYGVICERTGLGKVSGLALIYNEPQNSVDVGNIESIALDAGFFMQFNAKVVPVALDMDKIPPLLQRVREIYDSPVEPEGRAGCKDCLLLDKLLEIVGE
jgi:hypothetical protein